MHLPRLKEITNKLNGYTIFRQDKDAIINRFCKNPGSGLTIVSPSILEGLDFKEDICRAQIILKAPIPNLGDAFCRYKFMGYPEINLKPDRMFLDVKCAIDLNQGYGRVVRGVSDWGETYMVDLALTKRMAKACNVHVEGLPNDAPGDMGKLNIKYIKQGIQVSKDAWGRFRFKWPI
jgi:Rad3-related DNA helicase